MKTDDGGAVFPTDIPTGETDLVEGRNRHVYKLGGGITLLEYYAGQTSIPWDAVLETLRLKGFGSPTVEEVLRARAHLRFMEAEYMIAEKRNLEA